MVLSQARTGASGSTLRRRETRHSARRNDRRDPHHLIDEAGRRRPEQDNAVDIRCIEPRRQRQARPHGHIPRDLLVGVVSPAWECLEFTISNPDYDPQADGPRTVRPHLGPYPSGTTLEDTLKRHVGRIDGRVVSHSFPTTFRPASPAAHAPLYSSFTSSPSRSPKRIRNRLSTAI